MSYYYLVMKNDTNLIIHLISRIREKANRFISAELKRYGIEGLLPVHGDILFALMVYGELPMKRIAEIIDRKKSTVTTLVEKMETLGYVAKKKDETDNRIFLISLTEKGHRYREEIIEISNNVLQKLYKKMPYTEREQLVQSLKAINDGW